MKLFYNLRNTFQRGLICKGSISIEDLENSTIVERIVERNSDQNEFVPADSGEDFGYYPNSEKIRLRIEDLIRFQYLKNQFGTNCVLLFLPVLLMLAKPNLALAHSQNLSPQSHEQNFSKGKTEAHQPNKKSTIKVDLREKKISQIDEIIENEISQVQKQNLKLSLSNKREGLSSPITFNILSKNQNHNISLFSKEEKTSFVRKLYFCIRWCLKNKTVILSVGIGVLIFSLVIYYGIQKHKILNVQSKIKIDSIKTDSIKKVDLVESNESNQSDKLNESNESTHVETDSFEVLEKSQKLVKRIKIERIKNEKKESCNSKNLLLRTEHVGISREFEKVQQMKKHFLEFGETMYPNDLEYLEVAGLIAEEFEEQIKASIDWDNRFKDFEKDCS